VFRLRSWASSMTMAPYLRNSRSDCISCNSMPSVMNFTLVDLPRPDVSYRVWYATRLSFDMECPFPRPISKHTRFAVDTAATRRGWVIPMRRGVDGTDDSPPSSSSSSSLPQRPSSLLPFAPLPRRCRCSTRHQLDVANPASYRNCGTCVDLPLPVSPHRIVQSFDRTASMISYSIPETGRSYRDSSMDAGRSIRCTTTFRFLLLVLPDDDFSFASSSHGRCMVDIVIVSEDGTYTFCLLRSSSSNLAILSSSSVRLLAISISNSALRVSVVALSVDRLANIIWEKDNGLTTGFVTASPPSSSTFAFVLSCFTVGDRAEEAAVAAATAFDSFGAEEASDSSTGDLAFFLATWPSSCSSCA